jgi:hypothetical protein
MHLRSTLVLAAAFAFCGTSASFAQIPTEHESNSSQNDHLGDQSKLQMVRDVGGEYAKAVVALPKSNDGFVYHVGKPLDTARLHDIVRTHGAAANAGDRVQITKLDFESKRILVEINGGGRRHFHLRDHLQVGMGGGTAPVGSNAHPNEGLGTTIVLDYGKPLPEMSPEDLKQAMSPILDFSNQTSASVSWIDTVPKEYRKAIEAHQAAVGMDQDMVIAAMGRPEKKVREKDDEGKETEDWIYGDPPAKTVFVTFAAGKVVRVKEFND